MAAPAGRQAGNIIHEVLEDGKLHIKRPQLALNGNSNMPSSCIVLAVLLLLTYLQLVSVLLLAELHLLQVDWRVELQVQRVKLPLQHQESATGIKAFSAAHLASQRRSLLALLKFANILIASAPAQHPSSTNLPHVDHRDLLASQRAAAAAETPCCWVWWLLQPWQSWPARSR